MKTKQDIQATTELLIRELNSRVAAASQIGDAKTARLLTDIQLQLSELQSQWLDASQENLNLMAQIENLKRPPEVSVRQVADALSKLDVPRPVKGIIDMGDHIRIY